MSLPVLHPGEAARPGSRSKLQHSSSMPEPADKGQAEAQFTSLFARTSPADFSHLRMKQEFKKKIQGETYARNRFMMTELQSLGLARLPSYHSMKTSTSRESLLRARSSGDLRALRSYIRAARSHLGVEDPLVKRVGKVHSEAERCMCKCRDYLALESLQALPAVMSKIQPIVSRVRALEMDFELGAGIWEDPYLGSARRKLAVWREHGETLESMAAILRDDPMKYCDVWVQLAVENSGTPLATEFGCTITRELLSVPYVESELVGALTRMFERLPDDPEDKVDVMTAAVMSIGSMLSHLDRGSLDELLLKPGYESCATTLKCAFHQQNIFVFSALYQPIAGEVLEIQRDLQQQLKKHSQLLQPCVVIAARLGELLQLDPRHVCLRISPTEGLTLRLLVSAGQPSAQDSQRILGSGAALQQWNRHPRHAEELSKWHEAGDRIHALYPLRRSCHEKRVAAELAKVPIPEALARVEMAKTRANERDIEAKDAVDRCSDAKLRKEESWQVFVKSMETTRATMQTGSQEEVNEKKAVEAEAENKFKANKKHFEESEVEVADAEEAFKVARGVVADMEAAAEVVIATSEQASAEVAAALHRYQAFVEAPLASIPLDAQLSKTKSSSRSSSRSDNTRHRSRMASPSPASRISTASSQAIVSPKGEFGQQQSAS